MPGSPDIIIIGAGTMGAAAALSCTRAGRRVLALDRFAPPHSMGEHHGEQKMFRMSYYEHPGYVPMLFAALAGWQHLEAECGQSILKITGALYLGHPEGALISGCIRAARDYSLAFRMLESSRVRNRFPLFQIPDQWVGLVERVAGFIHCERAVTAMLETAVRSGRLELRTNEPAISWSADAKGVTVRTHSAEHRAAALIITAGPWTDSILQDHNIQLSVTRQVQAWAQLERPAPFQNLPCWAIDLGAQGLLYGFRSLSGTAQVKLARHSRGAPADPDRPDYSARPEDIDDFLPFARQFIPALSRGPFRKTICHYTNSSDGHFIIDRHPHAPNVVFGAGFSGHGFKFAPAVGTLLDVLASDPHHPHPVPFLSLSRFAKS
jgi:sarcosine oxidase